MSYDIRQLKYLKNKNSPVILDIGAMCGSDSILFSEYFEDPQIFSFEADPKAIKAFKHTVGDNKHITLIEKAVCHIDGKVLWNSAIDLSDPVTRWDFLDKQQAPPQWAYGSSSGTIKTPDKHGDIFAHIKYTDTFFVEAIKLDTWFEQQNIDKIDFLWSDVNGGEFELISGGINTLINHTLYFWTECVSAPLWNNSATKEDIFSLLPDFEVIHSTGSDLLFINKKLAEKEDKNGK